MNHSVNSEISTSLSLLSRVRRLDVAASERFSHLYGPLVYSWARRSGLQDSDSCDVTQEVFAVLASQLERYDQTRAGATFRGWLWGIVRNKLREHHRRTATEPHATGGTDAQILWSQQEPKATAPMPREVTEALANRALQLIRSDFPEQTWEIFWRLAMVGDKPTDVAAELGISVASVYTAKCRVLKYLRLELGDLLE